MGAAEPILQDHTENDDTLYEYYYGYRTITDCDKNGNCQFRYRPLTPDDFLEPEEGDVYMQGELHDDDVTRMKSIFRHHLREQKNMKVYCDMKIDWDVAGLENPAPDISIVKDVKNPEEPRNSFYVREEGTKPFFIMEVVSPRYRKSDVEDKPDIYRKAGVSEYIIADPGLKDNKVSYTVTGYILIGNRYVKMIPDTLGRIRSMTTGVLIGATESGTGLAVYDAVTGEELLSDKERAEQEKKRADSAENRAEQEKNRAEQEKKRAEQEKNRAEQEKNRADSAEDELMRLKAEMKALGISKD